MRYDPFNNAGLKLLALGLGVVLWFTVSGEPVIERGIRVPLELQNIPERLEILGDVPGTVDVRLRGSSSFLGRLEAGDVMAVLDLKGAHTGKRFFHLLVDSVRAPFGVEVVQVQPGTISLEFEQSSERLVRVVPAVEGTPAPGYVVGEVSSEPSSVEVVGPESRLRQLSEATTEPVVVTDARAPVRETVAIGLADAALRLKQPGEAVVVVEVLPARGNK